MPKKTQVSPLEWDIAVRWFGEEVLSAQTDKPSTLGTWRAKGVPADVALPLVRAKFCPRLPGDHPPVGLRDLGTGRYGDEADELAEELRRRPEDLERVLRFLQVIRDGGPDRRRAITDNVDQFLDSMELERLQHRGKKKAPG